MTPLLVLHLAICAGLVAAITGMLFAIGRALEPDPQRIATQTAAISFAAIATGFVLLATATTLPFLTETSVAGYAALTGWCCLVVGFGVSHAIRSLQHLISAQHAQGMTI